jgi:TonB family protein
VSRAILALLLFFSLPAAAEIGDACLVLNPVEVVATLRGPGVVLSFHPKTTPDHASGCFFARLPQTGSPEENLERLQSEAPPTLTVTVVDNLGSKGFDVLKAQPDTTDIEVPGIGDRAVFRRAANAERLAVASGPSFLILGLEHEALSASHEQDLIALAREVLATNFDGLKLEKHDIADRVLADDRAAFEVDPKNFAVFLMAMKRFDEARDYNLRADALSSRDPDVLYLQGVLDWKITYPPHMDLRIRLGVPPPQPLVGPPCVEARDANLEKVEEGVVALSKAVKLLPNFYDAMAYLDLLYLERADYQCGDAAARAADLKAADDWVDKYTATKKANGGKNSDGNVLSLFFSPIILPPPPPAPAGSAMGGVIGAVLSSQPAAAPGFTGSDRVRVEGVISEGLLLTKVQPVYPPLARQARIQGSVVLKTIIAKDGSIESLALMSGHPMLVPAAIDAVKQWKYKPYLINGRPVAVDTQVLVNFTLSANDPPPSSTKGNPVSQVSAPPAAKKSNLRQNIAPEEMWNRVRRCVLPGNAMVPRNAYMAGTVDIGLEISPDGDVVNYHFHDGDFSLRTLAIHAIKQWKFSPNVVQDGVTWSRVRTLVRFNADGTTSVDFARAAAPDDFGDPGNAAGSPQRANSTTVAVPKPESAPQCKGEPSWISNREVN